MHRCERFSHFLLVCAAIRLVAPDRTRVICGIFYLEGFEGQRAITILRVAFLFWIQSSEGEVTECRGPLVFATNAEWSLKSSSLIRADDLTIAIARVEANVQKASSLP